MPLATAVRELHRRYAHLGGRRRTQVGAVAATSAQGAGRVHAPRRERRDRRRRRACCWPTTIAARSPAGTCRASINSRRAGASARATTRWIRERHVTRWRPMACSACSPDRAVADARLEPQRVLAAACPVRLGQRARRRRAEIASCACNTSTASARTARTSTRNHAMKNLHSIVSHVDGRDGRCRRRPRSRSSPPRPTGAR